MLPISIKPPPPYPHPSNGLEINEPPGGLIEDLQYVGKIDFWSCHLTGK